MLVALFWCFVACACELLHTVWHILLELEHSRSDLSVLRSHTHTHIPLLMPMPMPMYAARVGVRLCVRVQEHATATDNCSTHRPTPTRLRQGERLMRPPHRALVNLGSGSGSDSKFKICLHIPAPAPIGGLMANEPADVCAGGGFTPTHFREAPHVVTHVLAPVA